MLVYFVTSITFVADSVQREVRSMMELYNAADESEIRVESDDR